MSIIEQAMQITDIGPSSQLIGIVPFVAGGGSLVEVVPSGTQLSFHGAVVVVMGFAVTRPLNCKIIFVVSMFCPIKNS